jgi:hypothetical protein
VRTRGAVDLVGSRQHNGMSFAILGPL